MSVRSRIRAVFHISPPTVVALVVVMTATTILCNAGGAIIDAVVATVAAQAQSGLAARYPGDVGIEQDPAVVFVENFEESTVLAVQNRWTDILNGAAMLFSSDVPSGSPGSHSLVIPSVGGGVSNGGHLYRQLTPAVADTLYVRYYIKYPTGGKPTHAGTWVGGHNPPSAWPDPQAGI